MCTGMNMNSGKIEKNSNCVLILYWVTRFGAKVWRIFDIVRLHLLSRRYVGNDAFTIIRVLSLVDNGRYGSSGYSHFRSFPLGAFRIVLRTITALIAIGIWFHIFRLQRSRWTLGAFRRRNSDCCCRWFAQRHAEVTSAAGPNLDLPSDVKLSDSIWTTVSEAWACLPL